MSWKRTNNPGSKSSLAVWIGRNRLFCLTKDKQSRYRTFEADLQGQGFDESGRLVDKDVVKRHLREAVDHLGKADDLVFLVPTHLNQLGYYHERDGDDVSNVVEKKALSDSKFITKGKDSSFESEPVVFYFELLESDVQGHVHAVTNLFPQSVIDAFRELASDIGMHFAVADTAEFAFLRSLYEHVDIEAGTVIRADPDGVVSLIAFDDGVPVAHRLLRFNMSELNDSLERQALIHEILTSVRFFSSRLGNQQFTETHYLLSSLPVFAEELAGYVPKVVNLGEKFPWSGGDEVVPVGLYPLFASLNTHSQGYGEYFSDVAVFERDSEYGATGLIATLRRMIPAAAITAGVLLLLNTGWMLHNQSSLKSLLLESEQQADLIQQRLLRNRELRVIEEEADNAMWVAQEVRRGMLDYSGYIHDIVESLPDGIILSSLTIEGRTWSSTVVGGDLGAITNYLKTLSAMPLISALDYSHIQTFDGGYRVDLVAVLSRRGVVM